MQISFKLLMLRYIHVGPYVGIAQILRGHVTFQVQHFKIYSKSLQLVVVNCLKEGYLVYVFRNHDLK